MGQYRSPPTSPCSHRPSLSTINEEPFGPLVTPPDRSSSFESTSSDGCGDYATVPLLLSYDEKSGLPYSSFRHRRRKERLYKEDGSDGPSAAWRIVKALAFLALSACISSFFFLGTLYIPFLAGETSSEFQSADDWIYAPLLVRESTNASVLDRPKGYNPLAPSEKLEYDFNLHIEFVRSTISTGETSSIIFHCRHNDISLCPSFYRVLLAGPTIHSPPHAKTTVLDDRRVQVEMGAVRDPGWYQLYTWPEYERCERFEKEDAEKPYHKLAVSSTPMTIQVTGPAPVDDYRVCLPRDDLTRGRWISKAFVDADHHSPSSPFYSWIESHSRPSSDSTYSTAEYIWAPYDCKPQHREMNDWLEAVKPETLLVVGDEKARNLFCATFGAGEKECSLEAVSEPPSDITFARTRSDGSFSTINFHFNPLGDAARLSNYISSALLSPASHILFIAPTAPLGDNTDPSMYAIKMRKALDVFADLAKEAKIAVATSFGVVQSQDCSDKAETHRKTLEPGNAALLELVRGYPNVEPLDVYSLQNDRPDAVRSPAGHAARPEEGVLEHTLVDIVMESWRQLAT
ncbi:hypothetical protein NBRC10512_000514 [Rhodotorula toruloides]|uniref:RHTO0S04e12882g1_1 n=2 Tax=Rhodotorula toruloides TaxID=5286 RepID=A0A061AZ51_RHOTO|nr:uncharacterized protein RHTO_05994 [Rhodotorula toruloides NP11]EMS18463.1 hypothetical protein RHTO_05994 [Rhodotorula toruloides NP11]CDR39987.1 RHTO0S04e12882g1_1 [Rhodotorula toruloides]